MKGSFDVNKTNSTGFLPNTIYIRCKVFVIRNGIFIGKRLISGIYPPSDIILCFNTFRRYNYGK